MGKTNSVHPQDNYLSMTGALHQSFIRQER